MPTVSRHILFAALSFCCISVLYFLSLIVFLPFIVTVLVTGISVFFLARWYYRQFPAAAEPKLQWWPLAIATGGIFLIVKKSYSLAAVHGEWDAWAIWNLHAQYLLYAEHWQHMFRNTDNAHPDYPLGLPAFLAFFIRLSNNQLPVLLPYTVSIAVTLAIPLLIFSSICRKNLVIAGLSFLVFAQDMFYLNRGNAQYADTLLAFFFLCAIACYYYATENKRYLILSAFFAASCAWIKNEGAILAAIFFVYNAGSFFRPRNMKYTLAGATLPVIAVVIFKIFFATSNDMVGGLGPKTQAFLGDKSRYQLIYDKFKFHLNTNFYYLKLSVFLYAVVSVVEKRWPDRQLLMLLSCMLVYLGFYVVTPNDLEWHLNTSLDRLMHQLMPAFIYVIAVRFSDIRFSLSFDTRQSAN
jgi:hypothetical protein